MEWRKRSRIMGTLSTYIRGELVSLCYRTPGVSMVTYHGSYVTFRATDSAYADILAHVDGRIAHGLVTVSLVYMEGANWTYSKDGKLMEV